MAGAWAVPGACGVCMGWAGVWGVCTGSGGCLGLCMAWGGGLGGVQGPWRGSGGCARAVAGAADACTRANTLQVYGRHCQGHAGVHCLSEHRAYTISL